MTFPFKTLTLYRVKQTFKSERSNDVFLEGQQVTYLSSISNHYDGLELCTFKDIHLDKQLVWHANEFELARYTDFFTVIPWPK
jgi:hypothetical protein